MYLALTAPVGLQGFRENTHKEKNKRMSAISSFRKARLVRCLSSASQIFRLLEAQSSFCPQRVTSRSTLDPSVPE